METGSDGNLKIKGGADDDADISAYVKKLESEKDVAGAYHKGEGRL